MSKIVDEVMSANNDYSANFGDKGNLPMPPGRHFAILTCMDARLDPAKYAGLAEGDPRLESIHAVADRHRRAGLRSVTGQYYEGGHWLGSFATYLVTGRGLPPEPDADKKGKKS